MNPDKFTKAIASVGDELYKGTQGREEIRSLSKHKAEVMQPEHKSEQSQTDAV